jgi:cell wall-associated NlpC family hydrolase
MKWILDYSKWEKVSEELDTPDDPETGSPLESPATLAAQVMTWARSQIGVPYKWGGQGPKASQEPPIKGSSQPGFDCSGFVKWVLKSTGQFNRADGTLDTALYNGFPGHAPGQEKRATRVEFADLKPGDLAFFKSDPGFNGAGHVGIVSAVEGGDFNMIHASSSKGIEEAKGVIAKGWWGPIRGYGRWTNPNKK